MSNHTAGTSCLKPFTRRGVLRGIGRAGLAAAVGIGPVARAVAAVGAAGKVTIAHSKVGFTCEGAIFIAQQQGYFRDEGLDLSTVGLGSFAECAPEMLKGSVDATQDPAWGLVAPLLPQGVQVGEFVATAGLQRGSSCICVAAELPIHSAADLRGQKVAAGLRWRFMFGEPLKAAGLDPKKDVDWQAALPPSVVASALREKKVAAAQLHQPYAAGLEASGVGRMILMQNMPPLQDDYCCAVIVPRKLVREDRAKAAAITRALMRGAKWIRAHPVETAQFEIDARHVSASAADNQRAMASLDFFPSVEIAGRNTLDVLVRFKRLGFLDAVVDENGLLAQLYVPVTDEL
jgi:NitT/TauT family transport system substrate-binding protein